MYKDIPVKIRNLIWGRSFVRCSFPKCRKELVSKLEENDPKPLGQIAHICALNESGPRFNPNLSVKERNSYGNLILLCSNHHELIDKEVNTYTIDKLKKIKKEHEEWGRQALNEQILNVNFSHIWTPLSIASKI